MEKVWIYQSDKKFTNTEVEQINERLTQFVQQWAAHGTRLKAQGQVMHNLFVVLSVDESAAMASGCSIDSSVHFIKQLEQEFFVNFFDRLQVAYVQEGEIHNCSLQELKKLVKEGAVDDETLVYNNLVNTGEDFRTKWRVPLKDSWHKRMVGLN